MTPTTHLLLVDMTASQLAAKLPGSISRYARCPYTMACAAAATWRNTLKGGRIYIVHTVPHA